MMLTNDINAVYTMFLAYAEIKLTVDIVMSSTIFQVKT